MASILVKFPTRERPEKFFGTLGKYVAMESGHHKVKYVVTCDADDAKMNTPEVKDRLNSFEKLSYRFGNSTTKIEAINADMDLAGDDWDILLLASDDMIPKVKGWDDKVYSQIKGHDAVWFYDGRTEAICTLSIMTRQKYEEQGYIYHPDYASLFCDNEWTDVAKPKYVPQTIIAHAWWGHHERDDLLARNEKYWNRDKEVYYRRKAVGFPRSSIDTFKRQHRDHPVLSVLICTLKSRDEMLQRLLAKLSNQVEAGGMGDHVEVLTDVDNGEMTIGEKRNKLMQAARGDYVCYLDDDDDVADGYLWLLTEACLEGKDCVGFEGAILTREGAWRKFVISLRYDHWYLDGDVYCRTPNHLTPIRREIALQYPFPSSMHGEDSAYSHAMLAAKSLETEEFIPRQLYFYSPAAGLSPPSRRKQLRRRHSSRPHEIKRPIEEGVKTPPPPPVEKKKDGRKRQHPRLQAVLTPAPATTTDVVTERIETPALQPAGPEVVPSKYSQNDEEPFILKHAGDRGRFLDVGAADGKNLSNTYALARLGWTGVCVEPNPFMAAKLVSNHLDEKIAIIAAALGLERKLVELWACDDYVSTTDARFAKKWSRNTVYRKIMVHQVTWEDLMALGPFHMINIDTEGTTLDLFDAMPKQMLDAARVLCVEHNGDFDGLKVPEGFEKVYVSAENAVLARK